MTGGAGLEGLVGFSLGGAPGAAITPTAVRARTAMKLVSCMMIVWKLIVWKLNRSVDCWAG